MEQKTKHVAGIDGSQKRTKQVSADALPRAPFPAGRWAALRQTCRAWWRDELERPLIAVTMHGCEPGRTVPELLPQAVDAAYDFAIPAETVVAVWDFNLARQRYLGDAFPNVRANFGPGHNAVFYGAIPEIQPSTVWCHPAPVAEIRDLAVRLDTEHPWLRRQCELYRAAARHWQGGVCLAMSDIVSGLDVLAALRGTEQLLLDLYDAPEQVERLLWETHEAYWQTFAMLDEVIRPTNPGWTAWDQILSPEPYLMQQCDFAYMISPEMFARFVVPELRATCRRMSHSFYHLDGIGQLPHLDALLSIPELDGIQWIPGAGQPDYDQWIEIYRRIRAAGKKVQLMGASRAAVDRIANALGSLRGFVISTGLEDSQDFGATKAWLQKHGVKDAD